MSARVDPRLELAIRERSWLRQRAADRRRWPSPQARARAFLELAEDCIVRERAYARIFPGQASEFLGLVAMAERLAEGLPVHVYVDGEAVWLRGDIHDGADPRLHIFKRLLQLSGVRRIDFDDLADRVDAAMRREQRSHERGLRLLENYMRGLPRPRGHAAARHPATPPPRRKVPHYDDHSLRSIEEWLRSQPTERDQHGALADDDDLDAIGDAILVDLEEDYLRRRLAEGRFGEG